jgi:deoxyribonuclease V
MQYQSLHAWNIAPDEAIALQRRMSHEIRIRDEFGPIRTIAGLDLSFSRDDEIGHAVVVVLSVPEMRPVETRYASGPIPMPYVPGLLSFRESPIALQAFAQLEAIPDLVMVDGAGIAHPRGLGIASHLGLWLDVPTIGVAKSFLTGVYDRSFAPDTFPSSVPLDDKAGKRIGSVLWTRPRTNPLYISPGHRVSIESAERLVIESLRGYRLPEPTRQAHLLITAYKKTLQ